MSDRIMETTQGQVLHAADLAKDDPDSLICFYVDPCRKDDYEYVDVHCWHFGDDACTAKLVGPVPVSSLPTREFDAGYGSVKGERVICFSEKYVYVKAQYDGSEWVEAVPRNPDAVTLQNIPEIGGG